MEEKLRKLINIVDEIDIRIPIVKQKNNLKNFIDERIKERDYVWATIAAYVGHGVLEGVESLVDAPLKKEDYASATCTAFNEHGENGIKKLAETLIEKKEYVGALALYECAGMEKEYNKVLDEMRPGLVGVIRERHRLFHDEYLKDRKYVVNTIMRAIEILQL